MEGVLLGACNCNWGCPCSFNAPPTFGKCEGGYLWHIEQGGFGDVPLDGLNLVWFAHSPGPLHEAKATSQRIIDENATPPQREALLEITGGKYGSPWSIFAAVTAKWLDPLFAPFDVTVAGLHSRARVGDYMELAMGPILNPVTQEIEQIYLDKPTGFTSTRATICRSLSFRINAGLSYQHDGQYAEFSHFQYSGEGQR
ncbi:MAG: hypothetical protein C5B51_20280 [Terriglobia bacterium]|nr:MAG: hypothetical protein C5B51_20280 [Terriglobia bacterium]